MYDNQIEGLAVHSDELERLILNQIEGRYRRVYSNGYGHDTCSIIMDNAKWYIVSILNEDFSSITQLQKETYRTFVRSCVQGEHNLLIIGQRGNPGHELFLQELFPNKIQGCNYLLLKQPYSSEDIVKNVIDFLFIEDHNGYSMKEVYASVNTTRLVCPECQKEVFAPYDVVFHEDATKDQGDMDEMVEFPDFEITGILPMKDWTENVSANIRQLCFDALKMEKKMGLLIFDDPPSNHIKCICPYCMATLYDMTNPPVRGSNFIIYHRFMHLNYDDICKIRPIV